MKANQYAKAIVAAVMAGWTAYTTAGGSTAHQVVAAVVAAVVVGVTTWGIPNSPAPAEPTIKTGV